MTPRSGRVIAWLTFLLGIAVSIAGNIGHAASDGMRPGEWAGAAFWPTALMLSVEILTRVRWQPEARWTIARFAGLILVSIVAAVLSYLHLRSLMLFWGEAPFQATIGPAAVDGLMLIAATALLSISKEVPVPLTQKERINQIAENLGVPGLVDEGKDAEISQTLSALDFTISPDVVAVDKPKTKVQTSRSVPPEDAQNAAFQAWMNAPADEKPSVRKLAELYGLSTSKTHRLITSWRELETSSR